MLAKTDPKGAVDVYCKFHISDPPTFDDGFILGEIVRLLMKAEDYEDKRLVKNMILYGKVYGLGMTRLFFFCKEYCGFIRFVHGFHGPPTPKSLHH